uniref:Uncharacterized protein n=1 Tax=Plectus sambesii TaxID=2011161 RepID=A0A914W1J1_9BILA
MLDDERANKVEDGDDDEDDDDNDDDDDETVQSAAIKWQDWAVLRLKSLLPTVHESVFLEFVRDYAVDVEAFFQNDAMCSNVLFIAPVRREIRVITSPTNVDVSAVIEPTDDEAKSAPRKSKTWQRKSSKKKKKKPGASIATP